MILVYCHALAEPEDRHMSGMARLSIIRVPFHGTASRTGRLTWSQQAMWSCIKWLGEDSHYFNLAAIIPVPPACARDDVIRAIALLIGRHEALRTRFVQRGDEPRQEVSASGTISLRVFDLDQPCQPGDGTRTYDAGLIVSALQSLPFDTAVEWPLRCALITVEGAPRNLALIFSHQAVDGTGVDICVREIGESLANHQRGAAGTETSPAWQPIDQALLESGSYGDRANARAVTHWRAQLAQAPMPLFPECRQPSAEPRIWRIAFVSPAAAAGSLILARRAGTSTGTVMLAATAAMLAAFTGNTRIALVLTAGNRANRRSRSCVAMMAQDALMTLSLGEAAFPEIIERAHAGSLRAYFAGHYDPALIRQVRAEAASERGLAGIDISAYFNDHPVAADWKQSVPQNLTRAELAEMQTRSRHITISAWPRQDSTLFIHNFYVPGANLLQAVTDTAVFPLARARAFLRALEELIVRAVSDTVRPAEMVAIADQQTDIEHGAADVPVSPVD